MMYFSSTCLCPVARVNSLSVCSHVIRNYLATLPTFASQAKPLPEELAVSQKDCWRNIATSLIDLGPGLAGPGIVSPNSYGSCRIY